MKRYEDIDAVARTASKEMQLFLNEATLGRNVAEFSKNNVKNNCDIYTMPVMDDGKIVRRTAVFDRENRPADMDIMLMQGETFSDDFLVIADESPMAEMFRMVLKRGSKEEDF